ncbi:hypothetical protein FG379_003245 [Cryptosporidium bovis]|uniref:uncharacterized protein n=1 Tax=Cryptosporidium bovis TaxID=310047 RepID=UPI00351A7F36|nr:hypothetical protein FG379_003245 [Cryptosporidium bovis]
MIKILNVSLIASLLYVTVFNIDNKLIGYSPTTNFYTHGDIEFSLLRLKSSALDRIRECLRRCCCCFGSCNPNCCKDDDVCDDDDDDYRPCNPPTDSIPIPRPREGHPKSTLERYRRRLNGETGSGHPSTIWTLGLSLKTIDEEDETQHEGQETSGDGVQSSGYNSGGNNGNRSGLRGQGEGFVNSGFSFDGEGEQAGGGGGGETNSG